MTLLAVPLNPIGLNDRTAQTLLDGILSVPAIFPMPGTVEERRTMIAHVLTYPGNRIWLVWSSGALIGVLALTDIFPHSDAHCHFVFFDRVLFGRRNLIWNLMGRVFQEMGLQRLTVEVPEYLTPLYKFVRKKLMFRLEGEGLAEAHPLVTEKLHPYVSNAPAWAARLGSRRERACWNPETKTWCDMLCLRLLRSEYEQCAGKESIDAIRRNKSSVPTGDSLRLGAEGHPGTAETATRLSAGPAIISQASRGTW